MIGKTKQVCASLSQFLTSFILQELTLGSRELIIDESLDKKFDADRAHASSIWRNGPYVYGSDHQFYLWHEVLVFDMGGSYFFGANHSAGIEFLNNQQGPIDLLSLRLMRDWSFRLQPEGSAAVYHWYTTEEVTTQLDKKLFARLQQDLLKLAIQDDDEVAPFATLSFRRPGQHSTPRIKLPKHKLILELFQTVLNRAVPINEGLRERFRLDWLA